MIIISSHVQENKGVAQAAILYKLIYNLEKLEKDFIVFRYYMNIPRKPDKIIYKKGKIVSIEKVGYSINNIVLRYIFEIFFNLFNICSLKLKCKNITYIGIDPLNAFSGVILKKIFRIKKTIFYTPDYSPQKFENNILNKIYHFVDKLSVKYSDETWNISTRVMKIREEFGFNNKNIFMPNVPGIININRKKEFEKYSLITSGSLSGQLDHINIIDAIYKLKKDFPKIKYYIAGDGDKREELENYVKNKELSQNVIFLGFLKYEEYLEYVSKMGIGVALYTGKFAFNYYGDSTKCREFMYFGLPVLTTDFHSTAEEIKQEKAGIVIKKNLETKKYINSIKNILLNYNEYSENSKILGNKYNEDFINKIKEIG